jgi:hypothetical protein
MKFPSIVTEISHITKYKQIWQERGGGAYEGYSQHARQYKVLS